MSVLYPVADSDKNPAPFTSGKQLQQYNANASVQFMCSRDHRKGLLILRLE